MRHTARMLSPLGVLARRHDPDRFFCTLFAPAEKREILFLLLAFNHELARAQEATSEPGLALIRLHWWREVVEGAHRRHEVASPLHAAIAAGHASAADLQDMIAAREADVEAPVILETWQDTQLQGPGSLAVATGRVLGVDAAFLPRLRRLGAGYGVAGRLRNAAVLAGRTADLPGTAADLTRIGHALLGHPEKLPRHATPAALPAVFGRRDLARLPIVLPRRGLGDLLAVSLAALRRTA